MAKAQGVSPATVQRIWSARDLKPHQLKTFKREVLGRDLPWLDDLVRARRPARLPVVLTQAEVRGALTPGRRAKADGDAALRLRPTPAGVLPPALRVKDVDFGRSQIPVRSGKGDNDRATMLPATIRDSLPAHLERVQGQHRLDLAQDAG